MQTDVVTKGYSFTDMHVRKSLANFFFTMFVPLSDIAKHIGSQMTYIYIRISVGDF